MFHSPDAKTQIAIFMGIDALKLADDALETLYLDCGGKEVETLSVDPFAIGDYQACVRTFIRLLGAPELIGSRVCAMSAVCRSHIADADEDARNPPGLQRAILAITFACASFDDAAEAIDDDDGLHEATVAAATSLALIVKELERAVVRHRGDGPPCLN